MSIEKNRSVLRLAHAKINLCLDIVGRRPDGFHLLDTVMQSLDLADRLTFSWRDESAFLFEPVGSKVIRSAVTSGSCAGELRTLTFFNEFSPFKLELDMDQRLAERIPELKANILHKTLLLWLAALPEQAMNNVMRVFNEAGLVKPYLHVTLEKKIPYEAGLGGASADAAAMLDFLDESFGLQWDEAVRIDMESRIGADVPFTRHKGSVRCRGIGEQMTALRSLPHYPCIVIKPLRLGVKTATAFKRYHEVFELREESPERPHIDEFVTALEKGERASLQGLSGNVFSSLINEEFPVLPLWLNRLWEEGSFLASLSGSGTACFALFENDTMAENCAEKLSRLTELHGLAFELVQTRLAY